MQRAEKQAGLNKRNEELIQSYYILGLRSISSTFRSNSFHTIHSILPSLELNPFPAVFKPPPGPAAFGPQSIDWYPDVPSVKCGSVNEEIALPSEGSGAV